MTQAEDITRIWKSHRRRYLAEVWIPRVGALVLGATWLFLMYEGLKIWSEQ